MPKFLSEFYVKIGGQLVSEEFMDDVIEIVVDSSLYLPEMFTILLQDADLKWIDNQQLLALGKTVEISALVADKFGGEKDMLMKGEIAALEPDFSGQGKTTLLIRGYNRSHRLHRGKQTRTFLKQTDSDIVCKIAREVGLSPQVDATYERYDYVIQNNQTNMEFLQTRAGRLGYKVFAADGKLYFKKGEASLGQGPELEFGENLMSFQPILAATHQVDKVKVQGWDSKQKQPIKVEVRPPSALKQGGIGQTGGDAARAAFGAAEMVVVNQPIYSPDEARALARGLANDLGSEFIQAEGLCYGHPSVKAGHTIKISGIGTRFSGKYFITSATHTWNKEGYGTQFSICGRQPNTVSHLLESGNGHQPAQGSIQGVVTGLVTNLNDPDNLGRVKVKYAWLGDNIESDWIRIATPMGGAGRGFYYLPEINDEVLIAFEHGDIHHPYIVGILWNSKDKPPKPNNQVVKGGKVNERIIKSRSGHVVILDDTEGKEQIIIRDKTGKNEVVINSKENSLTINAVKDLTLKAGGKINIQAAQNLLIKGQNLSIQGQQKADIKALQIAVNGTTKVDVKGAMINLN